MHSTTSPGWARVMGVLPDYIGGYLEWEEQHKKYRGKIKGFRITEKALSIELAWTIEQQYGNEWRMQPRDMDNIEKLSLMWNVSIVNKSADASMTPRRTIIFKLTNVSVVFEIFRRNSHAVRTIDELVVSLNNNQ